MCLYGLICCPIEMKTLDSLLITVQSKIRYVRSSFPNQSSPISYPIQGKDLFSNRRYIPKTFSRSVVDIDQPKCLGF